MFFITRNEILSTLAFFVLVMIFKITGITAEYRIVIMILPVFLAFTASKFRSNRVNIPIKGKKIGKRGANFLNDKFIDNKSLSYGATVLWLSTLFIIITEIVKSY